MSPSRAESCEKPRVVALGKPKYIAADYLAGF